MRKLQNSSFATGSDDVALSGEIMKIRLLIPRILCLLAALTLCSCSSAPKNTMAHGTGTQVGTASADVTLTEDRSTGKISGDTGKYGYFDRMSDALARELKGTGRTLYLEEDEAKPNLAEKAYALATYEIIQQVRAKGGNAVANVLSNVDKNYDPETSIETVKISITADAIKTAKKAKK
jgi:hypothetical protein